MTDILLILLILAVLALAYQVYRLTQFIDAIGEMISDRKDSTK